MKAKGFVKLFLFLIFILLALYVVGKIMLGINSALSDIPIWVGIVLPLLGVFFYDFFKEKNNKE